MPEETGVFIDLPGILLGLVMADEPLGAEEWTLDYDGDENDVMVIVIRKPHSVADVQRLAQTLIYLMDASGYAPTEVLRAALLVPKVNLDLKWGEDGNA